MNEQQIAQRILRRIKEEYNKQIKPKDKITFEEFRMICLGHLDIASETEIQNYKIGYAAIQDKLDNIKLQEKIDENKELKIEIERLSIQIKELKENKPHIIL